MAAEIKKNKKFGEETDIDQTMLDQWKYKVFKAQQERERLYDMALNNQEKVQRDYLETRIGTTKFTVFII